MLCGRNLKTIQSRGKENDTDTVRNFGKSHTVSGGGGNKYGSGNKDGGRSGGVNKADGDNVSPKQSLL